MKIAIFHYQLCVMRTKLIAFVLLVPFLAFSQKKIGLPLEDIYLSKKVKMVVKIGFVYDRESLDQLYPTFKKQDYQWTQKAPTENLTGLK
jgi:hypothetical protein